MDQRGPTTLPADDDDDDAQLIRRLLGGASTDADVVDETLDRMKDAAERLIDHRDTGAATRATQRKILEGLDKLIATAEKSRQGKGSGGKAKKRDRTKPTERPPKQGGGKPAGKSPKASAPGRSGGGPPGGMGEGGDKQRQTAKREMARGWGYLPQRERNEISQGFDERFLDKYREQILRYYRRLASEVGQE